MQPHFSCVIVATADCENFTFLGHREYDLTDEEGEDVRKGTSPPAHSVTESVVIRVVLYISGSDPFPDELNELLLASYRGLRIWKDHLATVLSDHFQQTAPLRSIKMQGVLDGLDAAVQNQLNVLQWPQIERDPIHGIEAEARCLPFDLLRYCVIGVQDSQP